MATSTECPKHTGEALQLVCDNCDELLCALLCPHDDTVTCTKTPGGTGPHKTKLLTNAVKDEKKRMKETLSKSPELEVSASAAQDDLKQLDSKLVAKAGSTKDAIRQRVRQLKGLLDQQETEWVTAVDDSLGQAKESIAKHKDTLTHYKENLRRTQAEVTALMSNSEDVTVHRMFPSVNDRLTTPHGFSLPTCPIAYFEPSEKGDILPELVRLAGSLQTAGSHEEQEQEGGGVAIEPDIVHKEIPKLTMKTAGRRAEDPWEACLLDSSAGPVLVVNYGFEGLYIVSPNGVKTKISKYGMLQLCMCVSPGGKKVYSVTSSCSIVMYELSNGQLRSRSEADVKGGVSLRGIKAAPSSGRLAVTDFGAQRLTIHSPQMDLLRTITGPTLMTRFVWGTQIITHPLGGVEWSVDQKSVYISDSGHRDTCTSVMKLQMDPSVAVLWRTPLEKDPGKITLINGQLYITYIKDVQPTVTVLSEADGSLIRTIVCKGPVREVHQAGQNTVKLLWQGLQE